MTGFHVIVLCLFPESFQCVSAGSAEPCCVSGPRCLATAANGFTTNGEWDDYPFFCIEPIVEFFSWYNVLRCRWLVYCALSSGFDIYLHGTVKYRNFPIHTQTFVALYGDWWWCCMLADGWQEKETVCPEIWYNLFSFQMWKLTIATIEPKSKWCRESWFFPLLPSNYFLYIACVVCMAGVSADGGTTATCPTHACWGRGGCATPSLPTRSHSVHPAPQLEDSQGRGREAVLLSHCHQVQPDNTCWLTSKHVEFILILKLEVRLVLMPVYNAVNWRIRHLLMSVNNAVNRRIRHLLILVY